MSVPNGVPAVAERMQDGWWIMEFEGRLDEMSAPGLHEAIQPRLGRNLILDLSKVEKIDSSGLGVVARAAKASKIQDRQCRLVVEDDNILGVIDLVGLLQPIPVHPTVEDAVADRNRFSGKMPG